MYVSPCATAPLKKTVPCKEPVNRDWQNPDALLKENRRLRDQLETALERIRILEQTVLKPDAGMDAAAVFGLGRKHTRLFNCLLSRAVLSKQAAAVVYGCGEPDIAAGDENIRRQMHRLRQRLLSYGIEVSIVRGQGWSMSERNKTRARNLMRERAA